MTFLKIVDKCFIQGKPQGYIARFLQVLGDEKYFAGIIKTGVFPLFCECWKWFLAGGKFYLTDYSFASRKDLREYRHK
jgi:hypothetical protein